MVAVFKSPVRSPADPLGGVTMLPLFPDRRAPAVHPPTALEPTCFTHEAVLYRIRIWS